MYFLTSAMALTSSEALYVLYLLNDFLFVNLFLLVRKCFMNRLSTTDQWSFSSSSRRRSGVVELAAHTPATNYMHVSNAPRRTSFSLFANRPDAYRCMSQTRKQVGSTQPMPAANLIGRQIVVSAERGTYGEQSFV